MANQPYTPKPITDIFTADTDIDRRKCVRTVPMRVLALGLGRTGTACKYLENRMAKPLALADPAHKPFAPLLSNSASMTAII